MLLFCFSGAVLVYIYGGYYLMLRALNVIAARPIRSCAATTPSVSIVITVHNEAERIAQRIEDIMGLYYPANRLEILIASDGSSDRTVTIARGYPEARVLDFDENRGRAAAQNDAVAAARGDLVFFTDAETIFDPYFLVKAVAPFADPQVGCVVGALVYRTDLSSDVSEAEGYFWRYEKQIRLEESRLGVLATGTGCCMGVRRVLWRPLERIDDCDFTTPLDVILQGSRVVFEPAAIAFDVPPANATQEFRTRVRQTSKNLVGTLRRWGWRSWLAHPLVTWALLSHKVLRWMTPFFLLTFLLANMWLLPVHRAFLLTFGVQSCFYSLAIAGLLGYRVSRAIPGASMLSSFCVANVGMAVGFVQGVRGKAPARYGKGGM